MSWEWKRPRGHTTQPVLEWWLEQIAVVIVRFIGDRSEQRGDMRTHSRMHAISMAGARNEMQEAARPQEPVSSYLDRLKAMNPDEVLLQRIQDLEKELDR